MLRKFPPMMQTHSHREQEDRLAQCLSCATQTQFWFLHACGWLRERQGHCSLPRDSNSRRGCTWPFQSLNRLLPCVLVSRARVVVEELARLPLRAKAVLAEAAHDRFRCFFGTDAHAQQLDLACASHTQPCGAPRRRSSRS